VRAGRPLHGPNLFPARPAGLRDAVLEYMTALTGLGQTVMRAIALGLGLDPDWFARDLTADPTILFRIFHYPPVPDDEAWGVGEHTDYGLLTLLMQDGTGGLQVRAPEGWVDVPADPDALVCNVGDMLERITGGRYRSTPHRARNAGAKSRLSVPFFFDPGWDAEVKPVPDVGGAAGPEPTRWDGARISEVTGTYGAYLLSKVAKVFPDLGADVL
jgi:isopenicillin N synthase-like dioxygenase